jgi:hypothetical protein
MKKVVIVLMFLLLVGGALAMDDAIRVKTEPGNEVRLAVRLVNGSFAIYNEKGIADEDGYWEYTFFSLSQEDIKYHVKVLSGLTLLRDDMFENWGISDPLLIDCLGDPCTMAIDTRVVEVEEDLVVVVNESVDVINDSVEEDVEEVVEESDSEGVLATGMAIFVNEDGSIRWIYSVGGGVVFLFLLIFIFAMFRHSKGHIDGDDKELREMEKRVEETEKKIKSVKDGKEKREKIERARAKLAEEEAELKELEENNDAKVEEQKEVVEAAEDKVEDIIEEN